MADILNPAPSWRNDRWETSVLWHGCTDWDRLNIEQRIDLTVCRANTDFGRGFYLTSRRRQAEEWAFLRSRARENLQRNSPPVVLCFQVLRVELARLHSLHFVRGDYDDEDYWSLVQHCRQSRKASGAKPAVIHDHCGPRKGWYDLVIGPVAANWRQRSLMMNADQVGFHTKKATDVLTKLIHDSAGKGYSYFAVPLPASA